MKIGHHPLLYLRIQSQQCHLGLVIKPPLSNKALNCLSLRFRCRLFLLLPTFAAFVSPRRLPGWLLGLLPAIRLPLRLATIRREALATGFATTIGTFSIALATGFATLVLLERGFDGGRETFWDVAVEISHKPLGILCSRKLYYSNA